MGVNNEYGREAESAVAQWLLRQGYMIREVNWRPMHGHLEVDIIAQLDSELVFVEVKARTSDFIDPVAAVDRRKMQRLTRAANAYLLSLPQAEASALCCRFDIVAVEGKPGEWVFDHLPDAFLPPMANY